MNNNIDRYINLIKKTGDRLIIHDSQNDTGFVIMDFDDYEAMVQSYDNDFLFEGFENDYDLDSDDDWHRAGDVLGDKYDIPEMESQGDENVFENFSDLPSGDESELYKSVDQADQSVGDQDIHYDDIENKSDQGPVDEWEEEPLPDEDPVFLEEPI
ncbi:MAG: hypothetical protein GF349_00305 [Candidatus Magasanikbacteria bacterium]|nr:hypothetical protein [Candidatus Magasanikbacteria bacterium]